MIITGTAASRARTQTEAAKWPRPSTIRWRRLACTTEDTEKEQRFAKGSLARRGEAGGAGRRDDKHSHREGREATAATDERTYLAAVRGLWSFMAIVSRFMARTRSGRPGREMCLSDCCHRRCGFHGMHGNMELGGRGCVSLLPPIKAWRVERGGRRVEAGARAMWIDSPDSRAASAAARAIWGNSRKFPSAGCARNPTRAA
jgi:hypothetical protein